MKHTLLALSLTLALVAQADHYWKGQGSSSDWTDAGNWINGLDNVNTVFGGDKIGDLPDESFATFSSLYTSGKRLWVESNPRKMVTFDLGEGASTDAGWTTTDTGDPTWTIGTNRGGDLTILGGRYTLPKGLYVGTGSQTSSLTVDGASVSAGGQIQTAKVVGQEATLTMKSGLLRTSSLFQIGLYGTGYLNMTGGTLESSDNFRFASDHVDSRAYATMSGGTINSSGNFVIGNKGYAEVKMTGGAINVLNNKEIYIGGSGDTRSSDTGSGVLEMDGGAVTNKDSWTAIGRRRDGKLYLKSGSFYGHKEISVGRYAGATGLVDMTGGNLHANNHLIVAEEGDGTFVMGGGNAYVNEQLWIGKTNNSGTFVMTNGTFTTRKYTCVGYGSGSGLFVMKGGTYNQKSEKFIVGQSNNANALGECIISNGVVNVSGRLWVAENNKPGIFTMEGGEFNVTDRIQMSCNNGSAAGKIVLNGGILSYNFIEPGNAGGQGGELVLNGGTLKARSNRGDFIPASDKITVTLGARGMVIDTDGHDVAVTATLQNADGLEGNGPIAKKGLGQLEISSALDLARTFTFAIDQGIGKIALTGANTLAEGAKIKVVIDPVKVEVGTAYTLLSGFAGLTLDQIEVTGSDDYVYTPELVDGTLSVTLAYSETAAVSAKYVDGEWRYYDAEGNLLEHGKPTDVTNFIFTGAEPVGELEKALATGHAIVIEARLNGTDPTVQTITLADDIALNRVTVVTDEGCAVKFVNGGETIKITAADFVNNGKIVLAGDFGVDGLFGDGVYEIEAGASVFLAKDHRVHASFIGQGELVVAGATLIVDNTSYFKDYQGTITVGTDGVLQNNTEWHCEAKAGANHAWYGLGQETTIKMAGGRISEFTGGGSNNEHMGKVVVADGTTSVWDNRHSRGGWFGLNLELYGAFSGSGTLEMNSTGTNRGYRFHTDLAGFMGVLDFHGEGCVFYNGIKGGTVVLNSDVVNGTDNLLIDQAKVVFKNTGNRTVTAGANATIGTSAATEFQTISFADGATLELVDDGALGDVKQTYVAFTSDTPVTLTKTVPTLVQPANPRGTWRLSQKEVTTGEGEDAMTTYEVRAEFRPRGLVIIVQ